MTWAARKAGAAGDLAGRKAARPVIWESRKAVRPVTWAAFGAARSGALNGMSASSGRSRGRHTS
ncbi:hypothetical protein ACFO8L_10965 [Sphaerisporangium corydalis]|uniref:Uncharacterized protein n=1 Tax=Sphaerisporangium corydalis TaxID=1441875 RepID=A0ABV9EDD9_9ACTN